MCGYVSKSIYKGLQKRRRREAIEQAEKNGTHQVFQVKKNGDLYKNPHIGLDGNKLFTEEAAHAEVARMTGLNPGNRYVVR